MSDRIRFFFLTTKPFVVTVFLMYAVFFAFTARSGKPQPWLSILLKVALVRFTQTMLEDLAFARRPGSASSSSSVPPTPALFSFLSYALRGWWILPLTVGVRPLAQFLGKMLTPNASTTINSWLPALVGPVPADSVDADPDVVVLGALVMCVGGVSAAVCGFLLNSLGIYFNEEDMPVDDDDTGTKNNDVDPNVTPRPLWAVVLTAPTQLLLWVTEAVMVLQRPLFTRCTGPSASVVGGHCGRAMLTLAPVGDWARSLVKRVLPGPVYRGLSLPAHVPTPCALVAVVVGGAAAAHGTSSSSSSPLTQLAQTIVTLELCSLLVLVFAVQARWLAGRRLALGLVKPVYSLLVSACVWATVPLWITTVSAVVPPAWSAPFDWLHTARLSLLVSNAASSVCWNLLPSTLRQSLLHWAPSLCAVGQFFFGPTQVFAQTVR